MRDAKISIEKSRHKIGLFTNASKIILIVLFANLLKNQPVELDLTSIFTTEFNLNLNLLKFSHIEPLLTHFLATIIFYYSCTLAFKLRMHNICFALPLTLTTPICLFLALFFCEMKTPNNQIKDHFICSTNGYFQSDEFVHLIIGVFVWWLSHLWTSNRIWLIPYNAIKR